MARGGGVPGPGASLPPGKGVLNVYNCLYIHKRNRGPPHRKLFMLLEYAQRVASSPLSR